MTYTTIKQCTQDPAFRDRVQAAAMKEAVAGAPQFSESLFGRQLRQFPDAAITQFIWPLSIDNEADYAYAVDQGNENPGGDVGVIGDDEIQAGVQTHWPLDPVP